jgi:sensor histidine kinase YesM
MLQTLFSGRARFVAHLTGWLLTFFVFFYLFSGLRGVQEGFARTCLNVAFLLVVFYGNAKILVNRFFETGRYGIWITLSVVFWILSAALRTQTELWIFGGNIFTGNTPPEQGGIRMFALYILAYLMLMIFSALYQLLENRRELETRHAEAQLNYLKAQINPHFLFNTLNNIYAAATLQHPRTADMVLRLSDLLRYVTYEASAALVPLEKELGQIRAYIELFRLKSDKPLPVKLEVDGDAADHAIEPLLLLPLVENTLKHSDLETNPGAYARISLRIGPDGRLYFQTENTFDPANRQKDVVGGVGLDNIRQRLQLHYRGRHTFETTVRDNIFAVALHLNKMDV